MEKGSKIYVAGHTGLAGSAIMRRLKKGGYDSIITKSLDELDLTDQRAVEEFFSLQRPEYVFLAAAKVGGIHANSTYPADFIYQNVQIQTNVIHYAWKHGVKKLLFLGSSCIYPKDCPQPMKEEYLMTGPLEPTNEAYAVAKIAGITMCQSYNRQHGTKFICAMPTNLYGPNDNYHPQNSHVFAALIRRFCEAKRENRPVVTIWGTGTPVREFLHSDDLADAGLFLMRNYDESGIVNVGTGEGVTIAELAGIIAESVGYTGKIAYDPSKPDGTMKKVIDTGTMDRLGWKYRITMREGVDRAVRDFAQTHPGE